MQTKVFGLTNSGNTCYINSSIQCLLRSPGFLQKACQACSENIDAVLSRQLCVLDQEPDTIHNLIDVIEQQFEKYKIPFGTVRTQHDSNQFIISLWQCLKNEWKDISEFHFLMEDTCGEKWNEPILILFNANAPEGSTFEANLEMLAKRSPSIVNRLPEVACFGICYPNLITVCKFKIPLNVSLKSLLPIENSNANEVTVDDVQYSLFGVVVRSNGNWKCGHYISFVLDEDNRCWRKCNDSRIDKVNNIESVLCSSVTTLFFKKQSTDNNYKPLQSAAFMENVTKSNGIQSEVKMEETDSVQAVSKMETIKENVTKADGIQSAVKMEETDSVQAVSKMETIKENVTKADGIQSEVKMEETDSVQAVSKMETIKENLSIAKMETEENVIKADSIQSAEMETKENIIEGVQTAMETDNCKLFQAASTKETIDSDCNPIY